MALRWNRSAGARIARSAGSLCALALLALMPASGASAKPSSETNQHRLDTTVAYLQKAQNLDGGFGGSAGAASEADPSAWVALALAAAGVNAQDQLDEGVERSLYAYLVEHAHEASVTT